MNAPITSFSTFRIGLSLLSNVLDVVGRYDLIRTLVVCDGDGEPLLIGFVITCYNLRLWAWVVCSYMAPGLRGSRGSASVGPVDLGAERLTLRIGLRCCASGWPGNVRLDCMGLNGRTRLTLRIGLYLRGIVSPFVVVVITSYNIVE